MPRDLGAIKKTIFVAIPLVCSMLGSAQPSQPASLPRSVDVATVLSWLPIDTETVVVADVHKGSFLTSKIVKRGRDDKNRELSVTEVAALFEAAPLSFLGTKAGSLSKLLDQHHVALAVEGSRHFRPPSGLGEMAFEGCEIVVFADAVGSPEDLPMRFRKGLLRQEQIRGQTVNVYKEKMEDDIWTTFVAFPEPNVLLMASNRDYLEVVLDRMKTPSSDRALPDSLQEWKYIDREAPFWGLRHYDKSQAELDPTSPFGGSKAANEPDEHAVGLVFDFDPTKGRVARVTYITGNDKKLGILERAFHTRDKSHQEPEAKDLQAAARELNPGVLEFSFHLSESDSVAYFFFILEGVLGHATYL